MALADFQWSLGGVVFGPGTIYHLSNVSGLGLGQKRDKVFEAPGADGQEWGREYRNGNTITFEGMIRVDFNPGAAYAGLVALRAAFAGASRTSPRTTQVLGMKMPGQPEAAIAGRPDLFDAALSQLGIGRIPFSATFVAAAPLAV